MAFLGFGRQSCQIGMGDCFESIIRVSLGSGLLTLKPEYFAASLACCVFVVVGVGAHMYCGVYTHACEYAYGDGEVRRQLQVFLSHAFFSFSYFFSLFLLLQQASHWPAIHQVA